MLPQDAPVVSGETTMDEYRREYREKQKEFLSVENRQKLREQFAGIADIIIIPRAVDMKEFRGSEQQMRDAIEKYYANDGRALNPTIRYPPHMIDIFGKDYALNARGIYYIDFFRPELVTVDRKVWIPSFEDIDWEAPSERRRRKRARIMVKHNNDNETRHKSEYAWEADAWADVFNEMRDDPILEVDKHVYYTEMEKTHPVLCTLTGETTVVSRIPDATFGLAAFSDSNYGAPGWVSELSRERLERLLLHRKCGLLSDPKWGEADLVFPFAAYEAKGWSGDCREARRQACQGAACYLDMLDNLARTPGPVGSAKPYQTKTSHQYQVFALTSFGAHWHLLVGYQRPRQKDEHAEMKGMSKTVYIFQKVWSARVTNERAAWELLSLTDQIHLWAITDFRNFVTEHLKPWHKFCDDNYLLDWNSVYNVKSDLKRMRTFSEGTDLPLPSWAKLLNEPMQRKIQVRAQNSLAEALQKHRDKKGKPKCETEDGWFCAVNPCLTSRETYTAEALIDHLRDFHIFPEDLLIKIKRRVDEGDKEIDRLNREGEQLEELDDGERDAPARNSKRGFVEEESLDASSSSASSGCTPGPSKRVKLKDTSAAAGVMT
ncbi:hypothetical protein F5884DRAFT_491038 [Xylogone sp. PMI_703]|nr:hypothetical protein F5884DRAFT_491038 [Xylogone sp. PMI_703]